MSAAKRVHIALDTGDPIEVERCLALLSLGLLEAVAHGKMDPAEACSYFFVPVFLKLSDRSGLDERLVKALHSASELEDVQKIVPESLGKVIGRAQSMFLEVVQRSNETKPTLGKRLLTVL